MMRTNPFIVDESPPRLTTVTGQAIMTYGVKKIAYVLHARATLTVSFVVCDVKIPVLSVSALSDKGFTTKIVKEKSSSCVNDTEVCPVKRNDNHF